MKNCSQLSSREGRKVRSGHSLPVRDSRDDDELSNGVAEVNEVRKATAARGRKVVVENLMSR